MEWEKLGEEIGILIHAVIGIYLTHRTRNSESLGNKVLVAVFFFTGWVFYWIGYVIQDFVKSFITGIKEGRAEKPKDTRVDKKDKPVDRRILYFKQIYSKHKYFFRLIVVLSSLFSISIGTTYTFFNTGATFVFFQTIETANLIVAFFITFAIIFIPIFTTGQVLYFTVRWVRDSFSYLKLTTVLSIVSAIIGGFVASLDINGINEPQYRSYRRQQNIKESISEFISKYEINLGTDSFVVGAICCVWVWLLYLSILWVYRARDSEAEE